MISNIEIDVDTPSDFYNNFQLSDEEILYLAERIEAGDDQEAIDLFIADYVASPGIKFQDELVRYLGYATQGSLKSESKNKLIRNVSILGIGLTALLKTNFEKFAKSSYSSSVFEKAGLGDSKTKKATLDEIITQFEQSIEGTISQSQFFVINSIKTLQKDILAENAYLRGIGLSESALNSAIEKFKKDLKNKYPEVFKAIKDGNVIVTNKFTEDGYVTRHYKADYYLDLVARNAVLDVDRTTNIVAATIAGERVLEYYWVDHRSVVKEREICQDVLANKVNGLSILALDEEAASKLGCLLLQEAESQSALGINCRHGVRRCSQDYINEINRMLEV
jgi:hypothetical protein